MTDKDDLRKIVENCQKGDQKAFEQLVDLYSDQMYGYFLRLCNDPGLSEDMVSQLFIKLIKKIDTYKHGSFNSWLFRVASNIFYDHLRELKRRKKLFKVKKEETETYIEDKDKSSREMIDLLQVHLEKLDRETKEMILLRFYGQLSFKEIAEKRSQPIGTVLSKVHRGLKKIRKNMESQI